MNIKFEKINKKQVYQYAELAPLDILNKAQFDDTTTVITQVKEEGEWTPAGMMQYSIAGDEIELTWIYVHFQYRKRGVGSALIEQLSDIPESSDLPIKANLYDHMMAEMPINEVRRFLEKCGFGETDPKEGMYWLTGKYVFRNLPGLSDDEATSIKKNVIPFGKCTPDMLMKAAVDLKIKDKNSILVADKNMSMLLESSKGYEGILQAEKRGDMNRHSTS